MNRSLEEIKSQFETWLRAGRVAHLRKQFKELPLNSIPRSERTAFANIARRAGLPRTAVSLLRSIVRSENPLLDPPTPQEVASYALALASLGALSEARSLVEFIREHDLPETLLACAYIHIWNWDYSRAVPYLKRYLELDGLTEYQVYVAKLNLASSYDFLGWTQKQQALLDDLVEFSAQKNWQLIRRDSLILEAQRCVSRGEWSEGRATLERALEITKVHTLDDTIIRKWKILLEVQRRDFHPDALQKLLDLKRDALKARRWEIIRDCDYFVAKLKKDKEAISRLYFGTPFESFRKRIVSETIEYWQAPDLFEWNPTGTPGVTTIDLRRGTIEGEHSAKFSKDLRFKLFKVLCSDFYRPFKIGGLFSELYPKEKYDSLRSPAKAFDVIKRLRSWLSDHNLPIAIKCERGLYSLELAEDVRVLIPTTAASVDEDNQRQLTSTLKSLRKNWPYQSFSSKDAARVLNLPYPSVRTLLARCATEGLLYQEGVSRARLYRFQK